METNICAVILAAGRSSRMGTLKQLLPLAGRPILEHVIQRVLEENFSKVIAVIGCQADAIQQAIYIDDDRFQWVINKDYQLGQSSSLKLGLDHLAPNDMNVMVFLGDLPFITKETVHSIYETGRTMLTAYSEPFVLRPDYKGRAGHPVFFGRVEKGFFHRLQGDEGAKPLLKTIQTHRYIRVQDEGVVFDIDTPAAYEQAKEKRSINNI